MAFLRLGRGEPLLFSPGITAHHRLPRGRDLRFELSQLRELARRREVWWVNRRAGLAPGTTMADLAGDYAKVIRNQFGGPVDVLGVSTGAAWRCNWPPDHPEAVRRLVLVCAACRLGSRGRSCQREVARWLRAGRPRRAGAAMFAILGSGPVSSALWTAAGWLTGPLMFRGGAPDCASPSTPRTLSI